MLLDFPDAGQRVQALLYADDIEIDVAAESKEKARHLLQHFLAEVEAWAKEWGFELLVENSALLVFTRDAVSHPPTIPLMVHPIPAADSIKFLGLHFDRKLIWKTHIKKLTSRRHHQAPPRTIY